MKKLFSKELVHNMILALAAQNPYFVKYYGYKAIEIDKVEDTKKDNKAA